MNVRVSKGGQISLPAPVRRRWATDSLVIEDCGDRLIIRPIPKDPVAAAEGAFRGARTSADQARARSRREEQEAERRKEHQ